jgi:hypothetical protein
VLEFKRNNLSAFQEHLKREFMECGPIGNPSRSHIAMAQPSLDEQDYIHERIKILLQTNNISMMSLVANISREVKQRWGTQIDAKLLGVRFSLH